MVMDDYEFRLYKKYERPGILDEEDRNSFYDLESIGLFRVGVTTNTSDGIPRETARPTPLGLEKLRDERVRRNPIKSLLHLALNLCS